MEQDEDDALFASSYTSTSIDIDESQQRQQQHKEGEAAFLALPRVSALPSFAGREGGRCASSGLPSLEWVRDEAYEACMACASEFTLTRRRHHCRRCGRLVCHACSQNRLFLSKNNGNEGGKEGGQEEEHQQQQQPPTTSPRKKMRRVCDACFSSQVVRNEALEARRQQAKREAALLSKGSLVGGLSSRVVR
ncbi:Hypothetical protein NocV09_05300010, partial [Nannochloropsis oceanica]